MMSLAICFAIGVVVGRMYAPRRTRYGLVVGSGLPVERAVRRPELREAFRSELRVAREDRRADPR